VPEAAGGSCSANAASQPVKRSAAAGTDLAIKTVRLTADTRGLRVSEAKLRQTGKDVLAFLANAFQVGS
jgi:hypothetical protein